jgi:hypothetical protein
MQAARDRQIVEPDRARSHSHQQNPDRWVIAELRKDLFSLSWLYFAVYPTETDVFFAENLVDQVQGSSPEREDDAGVEVRRSMRIMSKLAALTISIPGNAL